MLTSLQFWGEALGLPPGPTGQESEMKPLCSTPGMGAELPASIPACTGHFWQQLLGDPTLAACFPMFWGFSIPPSDRAEKNPFEAAFAKQKLVWADVGHLISLSIPIPGKRTGLPLTIPL